MGQKPVMVSHLSASFWELLHIKVTKNYDSSLMVPGIVIQARLCTLKTEVVNESLPGVSNWSASRKQFLSLKD